MEDYFSHGIHNRKYRLELKYSPETKAATINLLLNRSNLPVKVFCAQIPDELFKEDVMKFLLQIRKPRKILIDPKVPTITLSLSEKHELKWKNSADSEEEKLQRENHDINLNYGVKYWNGKWGLLEIGAILDPHNELVYLQMMEKAEGIKMAETTILKKSLLRKSSPLKGKHKEEDLLGTLMKVITECTVFHIQWKQKILSTNHELLRTIPITASVVLEKAEKRQLHSEKIQLFKHIFLTELITHMITSQFGRPKDLCDKNQDGYESKQYKDQELGELRQWGHRFHEFRDYPIQKKKKHTERKNYQQNEKQKSSEDSDDSNESDDQDQSESSESEEEDKQAKIELQQIIKRKKKQVKKKTKKWKAIRKKMRSFDQICNFTFVSGKEKSQINRTRYCLYQMARETDKTEALINFVQFAFKVYAREDLVGNGSNKQKKKEGMAFFLNKFKAKREIKSCFEEYTRESFFHKILNVGLRVLKNPQQLVYLRLPFSHMFWSIKAIYHRHKRAIFDNKCEKNKNRTILLFRGFEMMEKELKRVKKSISSFIEIEGFISTSLSESFSGAFAVNAKMEIEIPVTNLRGMYDNGFAQIRTFSLHPNEKQVLFNAFNIFRILSLQSVYDEKKELVVYTIRLQYGGTKQIESKVQKSQNLLDAEYAWKENKKELKKAQQKLEINRPNMTEKEYEKLKALFPKAQQQIEKREKELLEWKEQEYEHALGKLSKWEKELIVNPKHQYLFISEIENYGELLYAINDYPKAAAYYERRMKLAELSRAVQGHHWRKSLCLINKEYFLRKQLFVCYTRMAKPEFALRIGSKLLHLLVSTNTPQECFIRYELLFQLWDTATTMSDKNSEVKKYKSQFMRIVKKHQLEHIPEYQKMLDLESFNVEKEEKKKQEQYNEEYERQKQKQIKEIKEELKNIKFHTFGKYSHFYLNRLQKLVSLLYYEQKWVDVIENGEKYIYIMKKTPFIENRIETYGVFARLRKAYKALGWGHQFDLLYQDLADFLHDTIYNYVQFQLVAMSLLECLKVKRWRPGRVVVSKLIHIKIECKLEQHYVHWITWLGYVILLLSVSEQKLVDQFLLWAQDLYTNQNYTHVKKFYSILSYMTNCNSQYNKSQKTTLDERKKDYKDNSCIKYVQKLVKGYGASWASFTSAFYLRSDRRILLLLWQQPFSPLDINIDYLRIGTSFHFEKGELGLAFLSYRQLKHMYSGIFSPSVTHNYLRRINTLSKLHLNDSDLIDIPSFLEFWPYQIEELESLLLWELGLNLAKTVGEHQRGEQKKKYLAKIKKRKALLFGRKNLRFHSKDEISLSIQRIRNIYSRHSHYCLFTSNRRLNALRENIQI